ncbi:MAG TPA: tRNA epoxyqueuosine(34) reductase QueG [Terriglobales bacterium]|jgi:epoxyqueuosine reductase|nr:tRNA epoxyqueuosine(34) reductase QueG [Terriglobales bacterium]
MAGVAEITAGVKRAALEAGFELAGVAPVRDFPELEGFTEWIEAGYAGEMKYMKARDDAGRLKRSSLRSVASWARSVIVCAINYNTAQRYSTQTRDSVRGWISRYAWGGEDYHEAVMRRLRLVETRLHTVTTSTEYRVPSTEKKEGLQTRCYVDTGPVVERVYARYAGVGWMGKNTCILNQKLGSWLFLGVILTSLELEPDLPAPDRCGSCTRCIEACPTDALIAPYQLDANRCISYLTIEKRGTIPESIREGMGRHVFGCDICQDVCPWNRKAPATQAAEFQPREGLVNPALEWLAEMKAEEFKRTFRGSPVRRAKLSGLRRNAVVAMGNSGDGRFLEPLGRLSQDEDPLVAEHARWAVKKLNS